jgi:hypothetical protein
LDTGDAEPSLCVGDTSGALPRCDSHSSDGLPSTLLLPLLDLLWWWCWGCCDADAVSCTAKDVALLSELVSLHRFIGAVATATASGEYGTRRVAMAALGDVGSSVAGSTSDDGDGDGDGDGDELA